MTLQNEIEAIIEKAIYDFTHKWQSHEEHSSGVSEYAEEAVKVFSSNLRVMRSVCEHEWSDYGNGVDVCKKCNEWKWGD